MLVIKNIDKLAGKYQDLIVNEIRVTEDNTYEIHFRHYAVSDWKFTYILHRDMDERGCWVGTIRYQQNGQVYGGSHREDCSKTRLTEMDGFIQLLDSIVIEWKFKHQL